MAHFICTHPSVDVLCHLTPFVHPALNVHPNPKHLDKSFKQLINDIEKSAQRGVPVIHMAMKSVMSVANMCPYRISGKYQEWLNAYVKTVLMKRIRGPSAVSKPNFKRFYQILLYGALHSNGRRRSCEEHCVV